MAVFTIDQIMEAHAQVKSGADFPSYIAALGALGVARYEVRVRDGATCYQGAGHEAVAGAKYPVLAIAAAADGETFRRQLKRHQQGETGYPAFCSDAAGAGVEKWVVDIQAMTCSYYDTSGKVMLVETIPAA